MHVSPANEAGPGPQPLPASSSTSPPAFPSDSSSSPPSSSLSSPLRGSEYAMLSRQIRQARLLDRRLRYYAAKIAVTAAALVASWAAFALIGDSWWQLGIAVVLAVMFGQLGFLGHDAGHQQIFRSRKANYLLGVACGNLGVGLSFGWWTSKHNRHHAHPNTEDADPDIMIGVLAFSGGQAHAARGVRRLVFRCQAFLLFPMMFLEAASLHGASLRSVTHRIREHRPGQHGAWEAALLTLHAAGYLTAVFLVLSPVRAVLFILVQQGLFALPGLLVCPQPQGNARPGGGRPYRFPPPPGADLTQRPRRLATDTAFGGLNYQIEHHLFPSMPRPSLRRAQPLVAAFCADRGLLFCQTSLLGSYAQALRHLSSVGKLTGPAAESGTGPQEKMPPSDRRRVAAAAPGEPLTSSPP